MGGPCLSSLCLVWEVAKGESIGKMLSSSYTGQSTAFGSGRIGRCVEDEPFCPSPGGHSNTDNQAAWERAGREGMQ